MLEQRNLTRESWLMWNSFTIPSSTDLASLLESINAIENESENDSGLGPTARKALSNVLGLEAPPDIED